MGVLLLWFGWYGFNPGSALTIYGNEAVAVQAAVTTTLGGASGCLVALVMAAAVARATKGHLVWDVAEACNGALAGLVSVTASTAFVTPWAAVIIGAVGGGIYYWAARFELEVLHVDDPLCAFPVHGCGGAWGVLAVGLFADKTMLRTIYGESPSASYGVFMGSRDASLLAAQVRRRIMTP